MTSCEKLKKISLATLLLATPSTVHCIMYIHVNSMHQLSNREREEAVFIISFI